MIRSNSWDEAQKALLVVLVMVVQGCVDRPDHGTAREAPPGLPTTTPSAGSRIPLDARFLADGPLGTFGSGQGDATILASLVVAPFDDGERLVVGFSGSDGLAARSTGAIRAEFLRSFGVIRIHLEPTIREVAISDNHFAGSLAARAFVVRSGNGRSLYVDLHLRAPALARLRVAESPALAMVELTPGGEPLPDWPATGRNVVLLEPRSGPARYPLAIVGYARTFEANVLAQLRQRGRVVADTFTTASDYSITWGEFRMGFEQGPSGATQLFVGEHSMKDGTEQGVTVDLELR